MEYKDRLTDRIKFECNDSYGYIIREANSNYSYQLGLYEDIGYSPIELIDILLDIELSKGAKKWDFDKIEKWQAIKNRIKNS